MKFNRTSIEKDAACNKVLNLWGINSLNDIIIQGKTNDKGLTYYYCTKGLSEAGGYTASTSKKLNKNIAKFDQRFSPSFATSDKSLLSEQQQRIIMAHHCKNIIRHYAIAAKKKKYLEKIGLSDIELEDNDDKTTQKIDIILEYLKSLLSHNLFTEKNKQLFNPLTTLPTTDTTYPHNPKEKEQYFKKMVNEYITYINVLEKSYIKLLQPRNSLPNENKITYSKGEKIKIYEALDKEAIIQLGALLEEKRYNEEDLEKFNKLCKGAKQLIKNLDSYDNTPFLNFRRQDKYNFFNILTINTQLEDILYNKDANIDTTTLTNIINSVKKITKNNALYFSEAQEETLEKIKYTFKKSNQGIEINNLYTHHLLRELEKKYNPLIVDIDYFYNKILNKKSKNQYKPTEILVCVPKESYKNKESYEFDIKLVTIDKNEDNEIKTTWHAENLNEKFTNTKEVAKQIKKEGGSMVLTNTSINKNNIKEITTPKDDEPNTTLTSVFHDGKEVLNITFNNKDASPPVFVDIKESDKGHKIYAKYTLNKDGGVNVAYFTYIKDIKNHAPDK